MNVDLQSGQIVRVRSRQYLVEESESIGKDTLVRLSCLEDDAQGQKLEVFWEREVDAKILGVSSWDSVAKKGFDNPKFFSAYFHTIKWNCVTSTEPELFQSPYRAGIQVKAYQLEPLRKALLQPRIGLFIADDVGLGKTIEAGLILREMLIRQKIRRVVIACPPSVVEQWQEEMESRFGLIFRIFDREYVAGKRRERGYGINPWTTYSRFIISHALLRDENYTSLLRDWLGDFNPGSMFILDEAHNAAPASASRYAIDSQLTKTVRELAPRFEHKLFLSATPHNGHSNSFSALLEILDPQRFCRGVPVKNPKLLDAVMVRRLKQDLREIGDKDFPERKIIRIIIDNLPVDSPELKLSELLQKYRKCREERLQTASKSTQSTSMLVMISLQKRLLSSIDAFARTLGVHKESIKRYKQEDKEKTRVNYDSDNDFGLLAESLGCEDDRGELSVQDIDSEENIQMKVATELSSNLISSRELDLLEEMEVIANSARHENDCRVKKLIEWISSNLCPQLGQKNAKWNNRRVIIFTEYIDTKRYLKRTLEEAIWDSDKCEQRIATLTGLKESSGDNHRENVKKAFNADPETHPLRILIATDAAREGINLQNYCADLFHFDIPWNPGRMEQRNGRIDRKLQKESTVRCYYFQLVQRAEDRVLDVLIKKTATIQKELGSLSPVIADKLNKMLKQGIDTHQEKELQNAIEEADLESKEKEEQNSIKYELETIRTLDKQKLIEQRTVLENMLHKSKSWLGLDDRHFRDAISASLEILGAKPLEIMDLNHSEVDLERAKWVLPALNEEFGGDPTWAKTLDSLRVPRKKEQKLWDWRKETEIRPVVFKDPGTLDGKVVHLHLEHCLVQRLLGRFLAQGFLHDELTRACVCFTDDPIPKVIVLGRLSLYGQKASRLHDEIIAVAAEWIDPDARGRGRLKPLNEAGKTSVLNELENCLATPRLREVPSRILEQFKTYVAKDVEDLIHHLEDRANSLIERAKRKLTKRGEKEATEMKNLLEEQRKRIKELEKDYESKNHYQMNLFLPNEIKQIESDYRHWQKRVQELDKEIETEPQRIQEIYTVKATRVEPLGLVYLQPVSN
jgi:hypothetical protein